MAVSTLEPTLDAGKDETLIGLGPVVSNRRRNVGCLSNETAGAKQATMGTGCFVTDSMASGPIVSFVRHAHHARACKAQLLTGAKPTINCRRPTAAPAKIAANVTGALNANSEKADRPCPILQPIAITARKSRLLPCENGTTITCRDRAINTQELMRTLGLVFRT